MNLNIQTPYLGDPEPEVTLWLKRESDGDIVLMVGRGNDTCGVFRFWPHGDTVRVSAVESDEVLRRVGFDTEDGFVCVRK